MSSNNLFFESFQFHDFNIFSIEVDDGKKTCRLILNKDENYRAAIILSGVYAFRSQDFSMQNVISRILMFDQKNLSEIDLSYWVVWATSLSDAPTWLSTDRLKEWVDMIASGNMKIIIFEPSVGAQAVAIFENMEIQVLS